MRVSVSRAVSVAVLVLLAGLTGCDDATTGSSQEDVQTDLQSGGVGASLAAPSADSAGDMIVGMMDQLSSPNPAVVGGVAAAMLPSSCPETFELENGISGTCSVSEAGVATFTFGGTALIGGDEVEVSGTLVATPAENQPESGSAWTLDFDATATGSRGSATWSAFGTVTLDEADQVVDFSFTFNKTVTPAGGATIAVTVIVSPTQFELIVNGPRGGVVRFLLDRETMTGTVTHNGNPVATIAIVEGCAHIDYVDGAMQDEIVCPGA